MKILWFSNRLFVDEKIKGSGTWLDSMAEILVKDDNIELFNITKGNTKEVTRIDYKKIQQWLLPNVKLQKNGLPPIKLTNQIIDIVESIKPDIIHIWGTESYWGLLTARGYIKGNVILEIQGLLSQIKNYFYAGLTPDEVFKCIGLKEILKPKSSIFAVKRLFNQNAKMEVEMIKKHSDISTQSDWVRAHISFLNPSTNLYKTKIPLRRKFIDSQKWSSNNITENTIFTSISSGLPYKGLHVLIEALGLLKNEFPKMKLMIAGHYGKGIRESGYEKLLKSKIRKFNLVKNVVWLGSLDEENIVNQLRNSHVAVFPSFIESYGVAVAESLALGVPTVVSYSGALPEQGVDEHSLLFYPAGDVFMCASKIKQVFIDNQLSENLSANAIRGSSKTSNQDIADLQIKIYKKIIQNECT